jgi:hypothetical protein
MKVSRAQKFFTGRPCPETKLKTSRGPIAARIHIFPGCNETAASCLKIERMLTRKGGKQKAGGSWQLAKRKEAAKYI